MLLLVPKCHSEHRRIDADCYGTELQAYLYEHDDRFFPGWNLDSSWIFCTISFSVALLLAGGLSAAAVMLPSEGGYELIPNRDEEE